VTDRQQQDDDTVVFDPADESIRSDPVPPQPRFRRSKGPTEPTRIAGRGDALAQEAKDPPLRPRI